jgi:hypothetical protein
VPACYTPAAPAAFLPARPAETINSIAPLHHLSIQSAASIYTPTYPTCLYNYHPIAAKSSPPPCHCLSFLYLRLIAYTYPSIDTTPFPLQFSPFKLPSPLPLLTPRSQTHSNPHQSASPRPPPIPKSLHSRRPTPPPNRHASPSRPPP